MRRIFVATCVAACLFTCALPVSAGSVPVFLTGNVLLEDLKAFDRWNTLPVTIQDTLSGAMGVGYVLGVYDSLSGSRVCGPTGATRAQLAAVVEKYLRAHPEQWAFAASDLVESALSGAFPCSKQ